VLSSRPAPPPARTGNSAQQHFLSEGTSWFLPPFSHRWEYDTSNFLDFVHLASIAMLLKQF
jgi:hypothetical protein